MLRWDLGKLDGQDRATERSAITPTRRRFPFPAQRKLCGTPIGDRSKLINGITTAAPD